MIPYSLHVALLLAVCLLFYKLLLQKETYYRLNRAVLLTCLALAFTLPLIPVPRKFSLQSTAPAPVTIVQPQEAFDPQSGALINNHPAALPEVKATPVTVEKIQTPAPAAVATAKPVSAPVQKAAPTLTSLLPVIIKWAFLAYWCGVAVFGINLLIQVI